MKTINTPHNDQNITTLINDEILDLVISDKIFVITLYKASNNDVAVYILKRFWQMKYDYSKLFYVRCRACAYILNLIVKYGLKQVDSILQKIRNITYSIKSSQANELFF